MISSDIKSCRKSFSAPAARASRRLLIPPESHFHVSLQRYFNLTSPISNTHTDSQLSLLQWSNSTCDSITHFFPPRANLQSWVIENPSADAQTLVMVCDDWHATLCTLRRTRFRPSSFRASLFINMLIYVWGIKSVISESAVDWSSTSFTGALHSIHHPLPCLRLCIEHCFSHSSLSLLHSLFDTPHRSYFMCTCVYPGVAAQRCVSHIKLSHLNRERQPSLWLWLMASDNVTASCLYFLPPPPVFIRRSFIPAVNLMIVNLIIKLFSGAAHSVNFPLRYHVTNVKRSTISLQDIRGCIPGGQCTSISLFGGGGCWHHCFLQQAEINRRTS